MFEKGHPGPPAVHVQTLRGRHLVASKNPISAIAWSTGRTVCSTLTPTLKADAEFYSFVVTTTAACPTATLVLMGDTDAGPSPAVQFYQIQFFEGSGSIGSCGVQPNADFANDITRWGTDYVRGDLWNDGTYAIGPSHF